MKKVALLLVPVGLLILASGCASKMAGGKTLPKIDNDGYAKVFMVRKAAFVGSGQATTVELNGEKLLYLGSRECLTFKIPVGKTKLSAVIYGGWLYPISGAKRRFIEFEAKKGESYYFTTSVHGGWSVVEFDRISAQRWLDFEPSCVLQDFNEQKLASKPLPTEKESTILQKGVYDGSMTH